MADFDTALQLLTGGPAAAHAMGVLGAGVGPLAELLSAIGWEVSGCDISASGLSPEITAHARAKLSRIYSEHSASHIDAMPAGRSIVIRSTAVPETSAEIARAREVGMPVVQRGAMLAALVSAMEKSVVVCGSHGKTTTTTMVALALSAMEKDAGWCIGGTPRSLASCSSRISGPVSWRSHPFAAEGDESDGTLALYHPFVTVITSVDFDHMEHFASAEDFEKVFITVAQNTRGALVCNFGDPRIRAIFGGRDFGARMIKSGFCADADLRATGLEMDQSSSSFALSYRGESLGRFRVGVPGKHNALNAICALGALLALGFDISGLAQLFAERFALPDRRFERVYCAHDVEVISDYAHHPTEISALLSIARLQPRKRIVAVFQPHRYTRTKLLGDQFPPAFDDADEVLLMPVYAASEAPVAGGAIPDLYEKFRDHRASKNLSAPVLAHSMGAAWTRLALTTRPGDLVLIVGAGDIVEIADKARACGDAQWRVAQDGSDIPQELRECVSPMQSGAPLCSYGCGGPIRYFAQPRSKQELRDLILWAKESSLEIATIGQGSNTLVADTGFDGLLIKLSQKDFAGIEDCGGGMLGVGAAAPMAALLNYAEAHGLGGIEFMDSIPGNVGGCIAMNAGVGGRGFGDAVERVAAIDLSSGAEVAIGRDQLGLGYRACAAMRGKLALRVFVRLAQSSAEAVRAARLEHRAKRMDFSGMRTAGSVFKNPADDFAGRIIESAGLKGRRIGGAEISPRHANIISASPADSKLLATASDVLALIMLAPSQLSLELRVLG